MAPIPLSDDVCDRLVRSRDPVDMARLREQTVTDLSRRLRDELLAELVDEQRSSPAAAERRPGLWHGLGPARRHGLRPALRHGPRPARRSVAAGAATTVVVVGGLAMIASLPEGASHDGPLDVPVASAAVVLDRAALTAVRSMSVAPGPGQYGFVQVQTGSVIGTGPATGPGQPRWNVWVRLSDTKSDWYRADGSGRERVVLTSTSFLTRRDRSIARAHRTTLGQLTSTFPRVVDGAAPAGTLLTAGVLPYWRMNRLPTQPAALRRALERLLVASAPNRRPGPMLRQLRADPSQLFSPISQFLFLPTSPQLRAALFRVLAQLPGVQLVGRRRDRLGRTGVAVAVTQGGPDQVREELLFDPATSNVLQIEDILLHNGGPSTVAGHHVPTMPPGTIVSYTDYLDRGVVRSITQLPSGRRLPLKSAGSSR